MSAPTLSLSTLDVHMGSVLMHIASDTYTTLPRTVLEGVQNAIDADADTITIIVDMRTRDIIIRDDGNGVTVKMFDDALTQICNSTKTPDKLGRFGRGLVSPLNKCVRFRFTSIRNGTRRDDGERNPPRGFYNSWTFEAEKIAPEPKVLIPREERKDICHVRTRRNLQTGRKPMPWISELHIEGFSRDRGIVDDMSFEVLQDLILHKFGKVLATRNTSVHVMFTDAAGEVTNDVLKPSVYNGTKLPVHRVDGDSGPVEFHLYLVRDPRHRRKDNIHFHEWTPGDGIYPSPIMLMEFLKQCQGTLDKPIRDALRSGVFEGEVWVSGAKMAADREKFVYDDAFFDLMVDVATWWEEVGHGQWLEIKDETDSTRWTELGLRSMRTVESFLRGQDHLRALLRELIEIGTVGEGHTEPSDDDVVGEDPKKSKRSKRGGTGKSREGADSDGGGSGGSKDGPEEVDDVPTSVTDGEGKNRNRGRARRRVKGNSTGIQLDHAELQWTTDLVEVDWSVLMISINIRSTVFVECDQKDRWLQHLQEWVMIEVIHMLPHSQERRDWMLDELNSRAAAYAQMLIMGDERRRRREKR